MRFVAPPLIVSTDIESPVTVISAYLMSNHHNKIIIITLTHPPNLKTMNDHCEFSPNPDYMSGLPEGIMTREMTHCSKSMANSKPLTDTQSQNYQCTKAYIDLYDEGLKSSAEC